MTSGIGRLLFAFAVAAIVLLGFWRLSWSFIWGIVASVGAFVTLYVGTAASVCGAVLAYFTFKQAARERSRRPILEVCLWARGRHAEYYYAPNRAPINGCTTNWLAIHVRNAGTRVTGSIHISVLIPQSLMSESVGGYADIQTLEQGPTSEVKGEWWHEFHIVTDTKIHPGKVVLVGQPMASTDKESKSKILWSIQADDRHFPEGQPYGEVPVIFTFRHG